MVSLRRQVRLPLVTTALTGIAAAGEVTHTTSVLGIPIGSTANATLPSFDPSFGALRSVRVAILTQIGGTLGFENTTGAQVAVGGYASGTYLAAIVTWQIGSATGPTANPAYVPPLVALSPYDGLTDFAGASGVTHAFTAVSGDGSPSQSTDVYQDAGLEAFASASSVAATVGVAQAAGPFVPPGIVTASSSTVDVFLAVRYQFDPFPAVICRAYPWSGCPCGNASPVGDGCGNSSGADGGRLASTGVASISNDSLTLLASGMTSSTSLFFQGTGFGYAQVPYGDGLRCVTGTIARIATLDVQAGSALVPSVGGMPISVAGQVTQPGTRAYQVFYRDSQAFCTSATSNVTSGLAILWSP